MAIRACALLDAESRNESGVDTALLDGGGTVHGGNGGGGEEEDGGELHGDDKCRER